MKLLQRCFSAIVATSAVLNLTGRCEAVQIDVRPAAVRLTAPESSQQVLVSERRGDGRSEDVTRDATYEIAPAGLAIIDERGVLRPMRDGSGELTVRYQDQHVTTAIEISGVAAPPPVSFHRDIIPLLSKATCNFGGCHGKAEGQNGFKLSVFGSDPLADYQAIALESRGRRIAPASAETSLLVLKALARVPHGGGQKIDPGSRHDHLLRRWIAEGAALDWLSGDSLRVVQLQLDPPSRVLLEGQAQQLRVTAIDSQGNSQCVTTEAHFESNEPTIAGVDSAGLVQAGNIPGEAVILVRYLDHVAVCRVVIPRPDAQVTRPRERNFIDALVWDRLQQLGIQPSDGASDSEFLRRVYLDTIGTLPTVDEARAFLADSGAEKRQRLIDELLQRDEYADYWTMRWLNLLRADQLKASPQGTLAMQRWLWRQFSENRPYDKFVHDLLTVQGNTSAEGPGAFYKVVDKPEAAARSISQLLLGVRIECAQCHHHPSERWDQDDYVALAGFFTGITLKKLPSGEHAIVSRGGQDLPHPRSGQPVPARALGGEPADFSAVPDRRQALAEWMTAEDNPFFARMIVNRLWAHYFGRGLIEPIDDIRDTNPATNEPLMQALVEHLRSVGYDLKAFTRTLLNSEVYQLSSVTNASNASDAQNFSRAAFKTLPAEVLLDAICQSTGVPEKFNGWPEGYRAIQIWDNRMPSYFFTIFGRPIRATVCECERSGEPSISQALHLLNAPEIAEKIGHRRGRARRLAQSDLTASEIIDELYLAALARFPSAEEKALMLQAFAAPQSDRRGACEDVLWALLNSKEFVFNH